MYQQVIAGIVLPGNWVRQTRLRQTRRVLLRSNNVSLFPLVRGEPTFLISYFVGVQLKE